MPFRPPVHRNPWEKPPQQRARDYERERGSSASRGYGYDWRKFREHVLAERPLCQDCDAAGRVTAAEEVHHVVKPRIRPDLRLDPQNVVSLCVSCHSRRTGKGE
jgi:5-methylcytosine-specific restriction enzyme A